MSFVALGAAAFTLAGLLPPTPSPSPGGVQLGNPAPAFVVNGLDGKQIGSAAPHDHAVFLHFFTTTCASCRAELPNIVAAYARYRNRVTFVAVDEREPANKVLRFVHNTRIPYAVGLDAGQIAATLGVSSLPHSIFIDKHGIVRAVSSSPLTRTELDRRMTLLTRD